MGEGMNINQVIGQGAGALDSSEGITDSIGISGGAVGLDGFEFMEELREPLIEVEQATSGRTAWIRAHPQYAELNKSTLIATLNETFE